MHSCSPSCSSPTSSQYSGSAVAAMRTARLPMAPLSSIVVLQVARASILRQLDRPRCRRR
eukprot:7420868-Pyramimonas_sp.AAC.1